MLDSEINKVVSLCIVMNIIEWSIDVSENFEFFIVSELQLNDTEKKSKWAIWVIIKQLAL